VAEVRRLSIRRSDRQVNAARRCDITATSATPHVG
jgi:hypothetical protein